MRYILLLLLVASCGTYQMPSYQIKSVLAITEKGDTLAVPIREFERQKYDQYTRFRYNDNWYWNNWRYDFNWRWNPGFFAYPNQFWWGNNLRFTNPSRGYRAPRRQAPKPQVRPRQPRLQPRDRVRVNTPRGSNQRSRSYNNPNTTRNVIPNRPIQSRTNIGRTNNGKSRSNQ